MSVSASPSHLVSSSSSCSAMWGEDKLASPQDLLAREGVRGRGETLKICNLRNQETNVVEVPQSSPPLNVIAAHVLQDFVVLINKCKAGADADLLVFSIHNPKLLYTKKKLFNLHDFMRGYAMDTTKFQNTLAAFRLKTISLYSITVEDVETRVLDVTVAGLHGVLQYCKFLAVDASYLAHPFQAMPANIQDQDARVEHRLFCWHRDTWQQKQFVVQGHVSQIQLCLALHRGKLLAAQAATFRQWDIETGALERETRLSLPIPVLPSFPNNFHLTQDIGLHIQPHLGHHHQRHHRLNTAIFVNNKTSHLHKSLSCRPAGRCGHRPSGQSSGVYNCRPQSGLGGAGHQDGPPGEGPPVAGAPPCGAPGHTSLQRQHLQLP